MPSIIMSSDIGLIPNALFSQNHLSGAHPCSRVGSLELVLLSFVFLLPRTIHTI